MDEMKDGVEQAIHGMFEMCDAINKHQLCANDLAVGCRVIIDSGHVMAMIELGIMTRAVEIAFLGQFQQQKDTKP